MRLLRLGFGILLGSIFLGTICPSDLLAQAPVITAALNVLGQPKMSPDDIVFLYGTLPADAGRNYSVTVGGKPGLINVVFIDHGVTASITIFIPREASPGPSTIVLNHAGLPSNAFPVNLTALDPILPTDPYVAFRHNSTSAFVTPTAPAAPGEPVTVFAIGLGATNPVFATGTQVTSFAPTAAPVTLTVAGKTITPDFAGHYPIAPPFIEEDYQVSFTLPPDMPLGPQPVSLTIGGVASNTQTLFVGTQPFASQPTISKVTNGANFSAAGPFSAGSFVSIFGTGFGAQDNLAAFPNTEVSGISVLFNGVAAPIFHLIASQGQINALIPAEVPANGNVTVVVQNLSGPSRAITITTSAASPGIFIVGDPASSTRRSAAALIANTGWIVMPASQTKALGLPACAGLALSASCGQPARIGDFLQIYVTGLGKATPNGDPNGVPLATGQPAPASGPLYLTVNLPAVTIGGQPAKPIFSGLAPGFAGLYQINVQIPTSVATGDSVPIQIAMPSGGSDSATIAISQ